MTPEQERKLNELYDFMVSLKSAGSIPYDVDVAFRDRLSSNAQNSSKTVASETQAVDEAGAATYNVPKLHDGYKEEVLAGTIIYIPYYT